ncbi:hypothetical protein BDV12DRAFT_203706 [Aspergillus spectabilis]
MTNVTKMLIQKFKALLSRLTTSRTQTAAYDSLNDEDVDIEPKESLLEATRGLRRSQSPFRQSIGRIYRYYKEQGQRLSDRPSLLLGLNIVLLCISGALFWSSLRDGDYENQRALWLREQISMPSPVLAGKPAHFARKKVDGTLFPSIDPNIFRQEPSHEVDKAWSLISDTRPIPLTREDVLAIGKDPSSSVKLPDSIFGLGEDIYAGRIDVLHQLHCLNALRQQSYFDFYYGHKYSSQAEAQNDTLHAYHLSHCIYLLLQNILCHANGDVYTHIFTDGVEHPWPDFGIGHQCSSDLGAVMEFQRVNGVDEHNFVDLKADDEGQRGVGVHKMSSWFKKVNDPERFGGLGDEWGDGETA